MVLSRRPSKKEQEQPPAEFRILGAELLLGMERQKALAREMIATARAMQDRALKMGRVPKFRLP